MSTLEDRQHELQNRIGTIEGEIAELDAQYLALAADFHSTDSTNSMKSAETIERRLEVLRREKSLALSAQGHINKLMLDQKQQEAEEERRAKQAEYKQLADGVCSANGTIDQIFKQLVEACERRASLLHQLGGLGVSAAVLTKLGKAALTRSACFHGVAKFVAVERCAPSSVCSLTSTNVVLMGLTRTLNDSGEDVT
jgi:hypothetical protein